MSGGHPKPVTLRDRRKHQMDLSQGKATTDAEAWPTPEWAIRKARTSRRALSGETLGLETLRSIPELRVSMQDVRAKVNNRIFRNPVATDLVIADRASWDDPDRWIEP